MCEPWPLSEGELRTEKVSVTCEGFHRGEEEIELEERCQCQLKRELEENIQKWRKTHYWRTRIGGSMDKKTPIGRSISECCSRTSKMERRLALISSAYASLAKRLSSAFVFSCSAYSATASRFCKKVSLNVRSSTSQMNEYDLPSLSPAAEARHKNPAPPSRAQSCWLAAR